MVACETDLQFIEKRDSAREVFNQGRKDLGRVSGDHEGFEPRDVGDSQKERLCAIGLSEAKLQGRIFRTFSVDARFVDVRAIQAGPQRGPRNENLPPAATHVGQFYQGLILVVVFPVVWDQGKDFWRGSVDEREGVPHGPNQAEHLQCIVFKSVDLNI